MESPGDTGDLRDRLGINWHREMLEDFTARDSSELTLTEWKHIDVRPLLLSFNVCQSRFATINAGQSREALTAFGNEGSSGKTRCRSRHQAGSCIQGHQLGKFTNALMILGWKPIRVPYLF
jgi:hypothetical protein